MNYIIYSLYGHHKKYIDNILLNSELIPKIYPGWKCKVYYSNTDLSVIEKLKLKKWETIEIKEKYTNQREMINWCQSWRLYSLSDNNEYTIFRDAIQL